MSDVATIFAVPITVLLLHRFLEFRCSFRMPAQHELDKLGTLSPRTQFLMQHVRAIRWLSLLIVTISAYAILLVDVSSTYLLLPLVVMPAIVIYSIAINWQTFFRRELKQESEH